MESASPARHPRKLQQRHVLSASLSRKKRESTGELLSMNEQHQQMDPIESLAERVYRWSTNDLDYRPGNSDTRSKTHARATSILHGPQLNSNQEFCPQSLESLCDGPCGPIFDYLVENIKPRSAAQQDQSGLALSEEQASARRLRLKERHARELRCRELTLELAQKQREITETKERIKYQRQIQSVKEIHQQQSSRKVRVLQEFETLLEQLQPKASKDGSSGNYALVVTLDKLLEEVSRITRLVAIDGIALQHNKTADSRGVQELYDLYHIIQQSIEGATCFLDSVKDAKAKSLSALQKKKQEQIQQAQDRNEKSEAAQLLQLFREHHIERVVQIESVLNKVSACEREMDQLYSRMRFQAQRREHEKHPAPFQQELEETKAHLRGLSTALEFIQTEQENLVERVVSKDEQQVQLDAMSKASRAAEQKMIHMQSAIRRLIEMIRINREKIIHIATKLSGDTIRPLSDGLSQLSDLAQDQRYTADGDAKALKDLSQQSQQSYSVSHTGVLRPLAFSKEELLSEVFVNIQAQESAAASSLSADHYLLHQAGLQRHIAVQQLGISRIKEKNEKTKTTKKETAASMKTFTKALLAQSQLQGHEEREVTAENMSSKFEYDVQEAARELEKFEENHYAIFTDDVQNILMRAQAGKEVVQQVRELIADDGEIADRLTAFKGSSKKRVRYLP